MSNGAKIAAIAVFEASSLNSTVRITTDSATRSIGAPTRAPKRHVGQPTRRIRSRESVCKRDTATQENERAPIYVSDVVPVNGAHDDQCWYCQETDEHEVQHSLVRDAKDAHITTEQGGVSTGTDEALKQEPETAEQP